ncbi:MAG TPA: hypothetical protein VFD06_08050 [Candidatus Polarisedimenticolia bacterium]|nr:hypothetical protein [Candidatus Polarisedimenticolia bacterium]
MARTAKADYQRSLKVTTLPLPDPDAAARTALHVLDAPDAAGRLAAGQRLLDLLAAQTSISTPELVVPDSPQPHRRSGGRIVYSLQGDYRRRQPSKDDPAVARGGKPLGRIRVPHRTPARGDVVRPTAFLHTLLHEFCHHHDAESLGLFRSFHTAGFYARLRDLRSQVEPVVLEPPRRTPERRRKSRGPAAPTKAAPPLQLSLWSALRAIFKRS